MSSGGRGVQILATAFVVLLIVSLMTSYHYSRRILQDELFNVAQINAHHSAEMVTHWLETLANRLHDLAGLPDIQSMDWQRQQPLLDINTAVDRDWLAMGIADGTGTISATSPIAHSIFGAVYNEASDILGYTRDELMSKTPVELLSKEDVAHMRNRIGSLLEQGHLRFEARYKTRSGSLVPVELSVSVFCLGQQRMVQVIARDITERTRLLEQLYEGRERLLITLQSIGDAVISTDTDGMVTFMNEVAESLTGWAAAEALGKPMSRVFNIINEYSRRPVKNPVDDVLAKGRVVGLANHTVLISKDGRERLIADSAAPIRKEDGSIVGVVLVFRDMTEEAEAQRQIRYLSVHDKLTGLYNRAGLEEQMRSLDVKECLPLSLIMGDLNGLKLVNDAFGHQAGDRLLMTLAQILKDASREGDIVARLSGGVCHTDAECI